MAKRCFAAMVCLPMLLLLFSCTSPKKAPKGETPTALPAAFTTKAWVKTDEIELTCTLERRLAGVYTAVVTSPQEIAGLSFALEGEVLRISFEGKNYEIPPADLPGTSFFSILVSALDASMRTDTLTLEKQKEGYVVKGTCSKGQFTMVQQKSVLESLEIKDQLQATFSDFEAKQLDIQ